MKRIQISFLLCLALSFAFSLFAQDTKELILLQTSDVHSRIEPINQKGDRNYDEGGFVRRAAFLDQFRKEHKNVLLFDCGDISQGTPYYNMFQGEVEVKLMNEMGYEAMTIGNHEFDFGMDNMARLFKMAKFPVVCANYNLDATPLKDIVKPYVILEKYGLKIGVFGLGAKPEGLIQANKCEGVIYENPIEVSNKIAALLKKKGCRRNSMPVSSGYSDGRTPRCENTQYRRDSGRTLTYLYERPENLFEYGRQGSARHAFRKKRCACRPSQLDFET